MSTYPEKELNETGELEAVNAEEATNVETMSETEGESFANTAGSDQR